eukprot:749017-Hanusia_phi.AAC.4
MDGKILRCSLRQVLTPSQPCTLFSFPMEISALWSKSSFATSVLPLVDIVSNQLSGQQRNGEPVCCEMQGRVAAIISA